MVQGFLCQHCFSWRPCCSNLDQFWFILPQRDKLRGSNTIPGKHDLAQTNEIITCAVPSLIKTQNAEAYLLMLSNNPCPKYFKKLLRNQNKVCYQFLWEFRLLVSNLPTSHDRKIRVVKREERWRHNFIYLDVIPWIKFKNCSLWISTI